MSTLLNISTDHAVRNLYHHDRWGSANTFGDFLPVSNLDLWWAQWISESSTQENMRPFHGISSHGMNCTTKFHSFHRHVCLLAFFVLCLSCVRIGVHSDMAAWRMALFCSPCDEYFAEYFYWSRSAESLPPWSLRACKILQMNLEMFWLSCECIVQEMAGKICVWEDAKVASQSRVLECLVCFPHAAA